MSTPAPYNISLSSQTPTIKYLPTRDGLMNLGWNVTYDGQPIKKDPNYGAGASSHRTTLQGASLEIDFLGTDAYLFGVAPSGAYTVSVDGAAAIPGTPDNSQTLLAKFTGLNYGDHKVVLTVTQSQEVRVNGAILTVGLGKQGTSIKSKLFDAVLLDGKIRPNPFFNFLRPAGASDLLDWKIDGPKYQYPVGETPMELTPAMTTAGGKSSQGSTATFTLTEASAFFIRGSMLANATEDIFSVTVTPPPSQGSPRTRSFALNSSYSDDNGVLYWESGLDRDSSYGVTIKSEVSSRDTFFGFRSVEVLDAGSLSTKGGIKNSSALSLSTPFSGNAIAGLTALFVTFFARKFL